jgi:type I restriction enzyme S subunit
MGQAPKGESYNSSGEGYPLIAGAGDFGETTPSPGKWTVSPTKLSAPGDIILCIRATIGDLNWSDKEYCIGRGVAGLRSRRAKLDQNYLWHWLSFSANELKAKGRGATFLQVSKADIGSLQIPLPTLVEQKRIAAILDAADALRAKRRESLVQLDSLLQSTFLDLFGDPVTNPKGWKAVVLKSIADLENGDRSSNYPSGPDILDKGILFLSTKNISENQLVLDNCQFISEEKFQSLSRGKLRKYDLVITLRGTLGSCAIFDCSYDTGFINAQILILHPKENVSPAFLHSFLTSASMKDHFSKMATGVAVKQLTAKQIGNLSVPLPPLDLQRRFATIVESVEQQKARLRKHLAELDTLFASLQQRAFNGDLKP